MRIINQICILLKIFDLIDPNWLLKPIEDFSAQSVDLGLMISATINNQKVCCILDRGSTYTLVPHQVWKPLKLNPSLLDSSVTFNINSASHKVIDAVLGRINLYFNIINIDGEVQSIHQNLVLRDHLVLQYVLLGNDFLSKNSVKIMYNQDSRSVLINEQYVKILTYSAQSNFVDIFFRNIRSKT